VIRAGYSQELDSVIDASKHARDWIANLESVEREKTGIKTLKVGYNKVFGYYIEISRGAAERAPEHYIRKQTLVNAERFITPEMKEYETLVLNAEERIKEIETRLFREICAELAKSAHQICPPQAPLPKWMFCPLWGGGGAGWVHQAPSPRRKRFGNPRGQASRRRTSVERRALHPERCHV
jgi:hypothetical protein